MKQLRWVIFCCAWAWAMNGYAFSWRDFWSTRDHQAQILMDKGDYSQAAALFQRVDWRAAAAYRVGDYPHAAQQYLELHTTDGYYNAGNALAQMGQYQKAIAAYDHALTQDPHHQDALFNRQLVQKLLDQQQSQSNNKQQQQQQQEPSSSEKQVKNDSAPPNSSPKPDQASSKSQPNPTPNSDAASSPSVEQSQASAASSKPKTSVSEHEKMQAKEQWLRLIPDDPAYLLRQKFLRDHLHRQNGGSAS